MEIKLFCFNSIFKNLFHDYPSGHSCFLTFNDIDFCLKLTRAGLRNIYLARASLIHHECVTRGQDLTPPKRARMNCEMEYFVRKWGKMAEFDPFHSPYLTSMFNTLWLKPGIPSLNRGVPQMPTIQAESKNVAA